MTLYIRPDRRSIAYEHIVRYFEANEALRGLASNELQEIGFEIGMLGKYGLDTMTPRRDTRPAVAAVEGFLRVAVICIMYADFKRIEPGMDIGVDLSQFISPSGWETRMNPLFGVI